MVVPTRGGARAGAGRKKQLHDSVKVAVAVDSRTKERAEIHARTSAAQFVRDAMTEMLTALAAREDIEIAGLGSGRLNLAFYAPSTLVEACRAQVGPGTPFFGLSEFVRTAVARKAARS